MRHDGAGGQNGEQGVDMVILYTCMTFSKLKGGNNSTFSLPAMRQENLAGITMQNE